MKTKLARMCMRTDSYITKCPRDIRDPLNLNFRKNRKEYVSQLVKLEYISTMYIPQFCCNKFIF